MRSSPRFSWGRPSGRRNAGHIIGDLPHPILATAARLQLFGKSPAGFYLRVNKWIWQLLPSGVRNTRPVLAYGAWLHRLVCLHATRRMHLGTFFLRNRPALELMCRLAEEKPNGSTFRIAVLACSIGAEVYSILWTIRSARPDLKVLVCAVDISQEILNFAKNGIYTRNACEFVGSSIFERLSADEMERMFDWEDDQASVKPWLREGITWKVGDASDRELIQVLGTQDMVVANNFLCHMEPPDAEHCLRNIAGLVKHRGCLFVSGVDLDLRTKVGRELGWRPIPQLIEQIHDGDPIVRGDWPWQCWGLEPLNRKRHDWQIRYAAAFRLNEVE
jgi:SAM-dependent methyltransferase